MLKIQAKKEPEARIEILTNLGTFTSKQIKTDTRFCFVLINSIFSRKRKLKYF